MSKYCILHSKHRVLEEGENMAKELICKKLTVTQGIKKGFLAGPYNIDIQLNDEVTAAIAQCGIRKIELVSTKEEPCRELFELFETLEKILMLFDGQFYPIEEISFAKEDDGGQESFSVITNEIMDSRLNYFSSKDFCKYSFLSLIPYPKVLSEVIYTKFDSLISEMGIAYQTFLYSLSDNKMPVDINFAFLIELAEPFVELVKEKTYLCQTLSPGKRGTTLRMCIDALITHFGRAIFEKELNDDYNGFLDKMVGSRVHIMHIKQNQSEYFDGEHSVRYSQKLSLLYRKILFELLGITLDKYEAALNKAVNEVNTRLYGRSK